MSLSCYLWGVYLDYNIILLKGKRMVRKKKKVMFLIFVYKHKTV